MSKRRTQKNREAREKPVHQRPPNQIGLSTPAAASRSRFGVCPLPKALAFKPSMERNTTLLLVALATVAGAEPGEERLAQAESSRAARPVNR